MVTMLFGGLVGAAMLFQSTPAIEENARPTTTPDPLLGDFLAWKPPGAWHAMVRREARDPDWAPRTEAALKARYRQVPHIGGSDRTVRVLCASMLCEVAGTLDKQESVAETNKTMAALQDRMATSLAGLGLESKLIGFQGARDGSSAVFYAYWGRKRD